MSCEYVEVLVDETYVSQEIILSIVVFLDRCCLLFSRLLDGWLNLGFIGQWHVDFPALEMVAAIRGTAHYVDKFCY
jgi:hypothetical protein